MREFDVVDWLRISSSRVFSDEDDAFRYLSEYGESDGIFLRLCIDGIYEPKFGYDRALVSKIGEAYAKRHSILICIFDNSRIAVATTNPFDIHVIDDLRQKLGMNLSILLAKKSDVELMFCQTKSNPQNAEFAQIETIEEKTIENLLDLIISEAIELRASDVHFESGAQGMRVRNRIDGRLITLRRIENYLSRALISAIKLRSGLKIEETRLPQDGRIRHEKYDVRVSIIPTIRGENAVLRIFNTAHEEFSLQNIGLSDSQAKLLRTLVGVGSGLVLISGPTGSGKTTTLYSLLKSISAADKKVVTVEDPVEYKLEHVNQVAVNDGIGLTFSKIIRSLLRQSPNVIFIGEIRDSDTAQATIQAALTGHLVLSSVHSGDSEGAIMRLRDLGISEYLINSCVRGVIAQRLVRLKCKNKSHFSKSSEICPDCFGRGYFGRTGIFEILLNRDFFKNLLPSEMENFGYFCKFQDGIDKLRGNLFDADQWLFE